MRTVFMGTPQEVIAPLEHILNNIGELDIVAVISQPARRVGRGKKIADPPVAAFSKSKNILTLQPEKASSKEAISELEKLRPDLIITAAYGQILSEDFLSVPSRGTINIHPSLLPKYRGATPIQACLLNGDTMTGVSILFTVLKMDAGNIIVQKSFEIDAAETAGDLMPRMFQASCTLLAEATEHLMDPKFVGEVQADNEVTHCKKIQKEEGFLNFLDTSSSILNKYRGLSPWPGTYGFIDGKRLSFEKMAPLASKHNAPGFLTFDKVEKHLVVGTNEGDIGISMIKPAGKKTIDAASFWNGLRSKDNLRFDTDDTTK